MKCAVINDSNGLSIVPAGFIGDSIMEGTYDECELFVNTEFTTREKAAGNKGLLLQAASMVYRRLGIAQDKAYKLVKQAFLR